MPQSMGSQRVRHDLVIEQQKQQEMTHQCLFYQFFKKIEIEVYLCEMPPWHIWT